MRRIVFLHWPDKESREKCLELCSHCTPLVEPREDDAVYLDLSGCRDALASLRIIAGSAFRSLPVRPRAGLAASRLLAHIAADCPDLPHCSAASYQVFSYPEVLVVEVPAGQESTFIGSLPLNYLNKDMISPRSIKKLSRLGFSTIGELRSLSPGQLGQLTGRNPDLLIQQINGIDPSPVAGSYPPSHLTYPVDLEEGPRDLIRIEKMLEDAALNLEKLLAERHAGCRCVKLEIQSASKASIVSRQVGSPCHRAGQLLNILLALLSEKHWPRDLSGFLISLHDLGPLHFCQPDLFFDRFRLNRQGKKDRVEDLVKNLQKRFPGSLQCGLEIDRREQVLTLWDPWRRPGQGR